MSIKDLQKVYCAPRAKVIEVRVQGVLCGSQDYVGNSSTEQLEEDDLSNSIW